MRVALLTIGAAFCGSIAHAERSTELVVLGAHVSDGGEDRDLGAEMENTASEIAGFEVISSQIVADRLGDRGDRILTQALQAKGKSLLSEGKVLFEYADLEGARSAISDAVSALQFTLAASTDNRPLVEALLVQGNIGLSMGDTGSAAKAFKSVILIDPGRTLDPVHYPPKVVRLFDEVRTQVLAVPTGSIEVSTSDAAAKVHIDGRYQGRGTLVIEGLPAGKHHVLVTGRSGRRSRAVVLVRPDSNVVMNAPLDDFFVGDPEVTELGRAEQTAALYRAIGDQVTEGMVLIAGETGADEVGVQLYEPRTGNFSHVLRTHTDGDALSALISITPDLVDFRSPEGALVASAVSSEHLALDISANPALAAALFQAETRTAGAGPTPAVPEVISKPKSAIPWYLWAGAGAVVLGATTAALMLSNEQDTAGGEPVSAGTGTVLVRF